MLIKQYIGPLVELRHLWWGVCIGGRHYTGEIKIDGKTIELERKLSRKEAKELSQEEGKWWMARETSTNKFETLESLERAALKWCQQNIKSEDWVLIEHDADNPHRPIGGAGRYVPRLPSMKELAELWDKVPDSKREDDIIKVVYKAWHLLIK